MTVEADDEARVLPQLIAEPVHHSFRGLDRGRVVALLDPLGGHNFAHPIEAIKPVGSHC